jgi:hypothetical protein
VDDPTRRQAMSNEREQAMWGDDDEVEGHVRPGGGSQANEDAAEDEDVEAHQFGYNANEDAADDE